jgi:hypothetical protein
MTPVVIAVPEALRGRARLGLSVLQAAAPQSGAVIQL